MGVISKGNAISLWPYHNTIKWFDNEACLFHE